MTDTEKWKVIEEDLVAITQLIENRCYPDKSIQGARYICLLVRRELTEIDRLLLELDYREKEVI